MKFYIIAILLFTARKEFNTIIEKEKYKESLLAWFLALVLASLFYVAPAYWLFKTNI